MMRMDNKTYASVSWTVSPRYAHLQHFLESIPERFARGEGLLIHNRRNQLRVLSAPDGTQVVVKAFALPNLPNRLIYALFRKSKAERSFRYATLLNERGLGSPTPVAFGEEKKHGVWFGRSYYVSVKSTLPYTFSDVADGKFNNTEAEYALLWAVGRFTARFHNADMLHKDYNNGNLLLGFDSKGEARVELVDLNRIRFHRVGKTEGLRNFTERITADIRQWTVMGESYAKERGLDAKKCLEKIIDLQTKSERK